MLTVSLDCSFGVSSYSCAKNASASSGESSSMSCSKTLCSSAERLFHAASNSCSLAALTKASISFFMVRPPLAAKSGFSKSMGFRESKNRPVATNFQFLKILAPLGQLLVGACLPQTLPDKSKGALSAPMLFLSLLLFQFKLTLLFCFALFTAKCFSHQLVFFSLHLQRLL